MCKGSITHADYVGKRPQGVGMGRKPALWLKDGDRVEVSLEKVGSCVNRVVYDKPSPKL
jgi:fumarylacetoacetate (FAA) hydrolase family protein